MDQNLIANILSATLFVVALFVALRAFVVYARSRSRRLLILGYAMTIISLTALAGFLGDNLTSVSLNVDWFNYIGQTVSFVFILLSLVNNSDDYLRRLANWQLVLSLLLLVLFLLSPILPPEFPDPVLTKSVLSGSRGVVCLAIFLYYASLYMDKHTRFSFLMSVAFFLLASGYLLIIPKYSSPNDTLDHIGDLVRVGGLLALLTAMLAG
jgi:hypothetical protein